MILQHIADSTIIYTPKSLPNIAITKPNPKHSVRINCKNVIVYIQYIFKLIKSKRVYRVLTLTSFTVSIS